MKIETINVSVVRVVDGNDTWIIHQSHGVDKVSYIAIHQNGEKRISLSTKMGKNVNHILSRVMMVLFVCSIKVCWMS
jgi:hypothetical protein